MREPFEVLQDAADLSPIRVIAAAATLSYYPDTGTIFYEDLSEHPGGQPLSAELAELAAVNWLKQLDLLPDDPYQAELEQDEQMYWVNIRSASGPDGQRLISSQPGYRLLVIPGGQIVLAHGGWYQDAGSVIVPVVDYRQALQALESGAGELICRGFGSYEPAEATITQASWGYQLAFTLDFTPYLVPVAIFEGDLTPIGEAARPFLAYVSLVKPAIKKNAGNFVLQTELPQAVAEARVIKERPLTVSESEIPALLTVLGTEDAEISSTSWDGGWLWRGTWYPEAPAREMISLEQAEEVARELATRLPALPGILGEPVLADTGLEEFCWFTFPLLYDGISVNALGASSSSYLGIQINRSTGAVTTVNCAKPMQLQAEAQQLITPQQAWQRLLENEAIVYVDYVGEALAAANFSVQESRVTEVTLAYTPRNRNFARNEFYDLKYFFRGTATVGAREIGFTAVVDAEK